MRANVDVTAAPSSGISPGSAPRPCRLEITPYGAHLEVVHVNADHVADLRATDLDRPGDDVRSLTRDISVQIRRRHRDRVVEHTRRIDAVAGEERHRVTALVLEDALVADGIDHDEIARINRRHERRVLVGQPAPRRGLWRRGQVMV